MADNKKTPSMKVKKGDTVVVLSGKDKGAKGRVIAAYPKDQRVLVEGVGRVKKHTRISSTQRGAQQGGIVTQEAPIHVSNVMVIDSEEDRKSTRLNSSHANISYAVFCLKKKKNPPLTPSYPFMLLH